MTFRRIVQWPTFPSLLLFLFLVIINTIVSSNFMNQSSWASFLQTTTPTILVSMGMAVVLLGGGIDLSVGAVVSVVNVIIATTSQGFKHLGVHYQSPSVVVPLVISLIVALAFGFFNGFLISVVRINPLLATFSSSFIGTGVALTVLPTPGGVIPTVLQNLYYDNIVGTIPVCLLLILLLYLIWYFMLLTRFRFHLYAVGHNSLKAFVSGVKVSRVVFATYVFSAFAAWLAGVAISADFGGGDPSVGLRITLNAIAGAVIGGVSIMGGVGKISGGIFGALFVNLILVTILGLSIPGFLQELVSGIIIVVGLVSAVYLGTRGKQLVAVRELRQK